MENLTYYNKYLLGLTSLSPSIFSRSDFIPPGPQLIQEEQIHYQLGGSTRFSLGTLEKGHSHSGEDLKTLEQRETYKGLGGASMSGSRAKPGTPTTES